MTNSQTPAPGQRNALGLPRCGALAPAFALANVARPADAEPVRLRAWRQRRPVLLALLPAAAGARRSAWLRALAARRSDLAEARAVTLAIAEGDREAVHTLWQAAIRQTDISFPLLADTTGATLAAYLGPSPTQPALALVDQYSVLLALLPASATTSDHQSHPDQPDQPDLDAALREFAFAEQADCACGQPIWPVEE